MEIPVIIMHNETRTYGEIADDIASHTADLGGDVQRYIVAPAMLDMVGPVRGKNILELFCGAGYLSRRLATLGANVTAVDTSERLIEIAGEINRRENHPIKYEVADSSDLSVIDDSAFDDIVCNMGLMMTRDLSGTVAELARLVKLGGRFVFSVLHPCFCMPDACWAGDEAGGRQYKSVDNYFAEGWWLSEMEAVVRSGVKIRHRVLSTYVNALSARGFNVRRTSEPRPAPDILVLKPHLDPYDRLPAAMIVEAIFPYL